MVGFDFFLPKPNWLAFAALSALVYDFAEALKAVQQDPHSSVPVFQAPC